MNSSSSPSSAYSAAFNLLTSVNWLICVFGTVCNGLIVFVSIKDKSLHTISTALIALNSLLDTGNQLIWVTLFTWIQFMQPKWTLTTCLAASMPSLACFVGSYFCIFLISFDRLVAVLCPIWYRTKNIKVYFGGLFILAIIHFIATLQFPYRNVMVNDPQPDRLVLCSPPATLSGQLGDFFHLACLFTNFLTIFFYSVLWLLLKSRPITKHEDTRRIVKSLMLITLVVLSGWIVNGISKLVGPAFTPNTVSQIVFAKTSQILNMCSLSSNLLVLYFCSQKYRTALQRVFRGLCSGGNSNNVQQQSHVTAINLWAIPSVHVSGTRNVGELNLPNC